MMAIDDLLKRVDDPALRDALTREFLSVRDDKQFGLVFERHLPESVRLQWHNDYSSVSLSAPILGTITENPLCPNLKLADRMGTLTETINAQAPHAITERGLLPANDQCEGRGYRD